MKYLFIVIILLLLIIMIQFINVRKRIIKNEKKKNMYEYTYYVMNTWIKIKNSGLSLNDFCKRNKFNKVAIYAVGEIGTRIYEELKDSDIQVEYFTDKKFIENNNYMEYDGIPIVNVENYKYKNDIDVIIVSTVFYMESITKTLIDLGITKPIISLEQIVSELHNSLNSDN